MNRTAIKGIIIIALLSLSFLIGCSGMEYAPQKGVTYIHRELPEAERAVEEAHVAGKDRECPEEFNTAKNMVDRAYEIYWMCRTDEAIAMAQEATDKAKALCLPKPVVKPVIESPIADFSGTPTIGNKPLSVRFTDKSTGNIDNWSWEFGDGATSNVRNPSHTYLTAGNYEVTLTVMGPGGSDSEAKASYVRVNEPPAPKTIDKMTLHVNFDFDKAIIREVDKIELDKAVRFVKKYPGAKISIEGHTDSIGTEKYNQGLSERRADAVKRYIIEKGGCEASDITAVGHGESKPVGPNTTQEGRAKNRRVEILILSE